MLWGAPRDSGERHDYFNLFTIDMYRMMYNQGPTDAERRAYLESRLPLGDWIVIDDTFKQFYQHLPEATHHAGKQYYRDLFSGKLGFHLVKTFKVYPSLFGRSINDDGAELTFRLFDHPTVYMFQRDAPTNGSN